MHVTHLFPGRGVKIMQKTDTSDHRTAASVKFEACGLPATGPASQYLLLGLTGRFWAEKGAERRPGCEGAEQPEERRTRWGFGVRKS